MIKHSKLKNFFFYATIFLLPFQTRLILRGVDFSPYQTISIYIFDIFLIVSLFLFFKKKFKKITKNKNLLLILSFLDFSVFFSLLFAQNEILAIYAYLKFLLALGFFYLFYLFFNKKVLFVFFGTVFLNACFAIWQFFTQSSFACKYLGLAGHNPFDLGVSVLELSNGRFLRAYGFLDHPNILGGFLAISLLVLLYWFLAVKKIRIYNFIVFVFVYGTLLWALFLSFSRSAWIAFSFGFFLFLFDAVLKKDFLKQKKLLQMLFAGILFFTLIFNPYNDLILGRLKAQNRLELKSMEERLDSYEQAKNIIQANWLYGVGVGNYTTVLEAQNPKQKKWAYQDPHNVFLLIWAEAGIFSLLFFVVLLVFLIKKAQPNKIPILAGLLPLLLFDHWLWSLHFGIMFLFFVFAFVLQKNKI